MDQGDGDNRRGLSPARATLAFALVGLIALAPLGFAAYPPLHDYPAHLARIDILARWASTPELQQWYDVGSFILPNIAMDVVAFELAKILPITLAGRVFVALTLVLMLGGAMTLHRVLYRRLSLWPLVSSVFLYNWILLYGFLNYLFGVAVLLWATAAWVVVAEKHPVVRVIVGTCLATVLFFCHFVALLLYAGVLAGYQLQRAVERRVSGNVDPVKELLTGVAVFVIPVALFLSSATSGSEPIIAYSRPFLLSKFFFAWRSCMAGDWMLDVALTVTAVASLLVVLLGGTFHLAGQMRLPLALLVAAYFAMPEQVGQALYLDARMPIAIVFLAIGSIDPDVYSTRLRGAVVVALSVPMILRFGYLTHLWRRYDGVIETIVHSVTALPQGSLVFVATAASVPSMRDMDLSLWQPPLKHVVSLASIGRAVFVPATWAYPSLQPITVTPRYEAMYEFQGRNPIYVANTKIVGFLVGRIRWLAAGTNEHDAPLFLLVLYPERAGLEAPPTTRVAAAGPSFMLLALTPPEQSGRRYGLR